MGKQPYELSVWKDVFVPETATTSGYITDEKVAVIASDRMDSELKAYNVTLKEQNNGDCSLTFSMLYDYEVDGKRKNNPLFELLANETKLKLRRGEDYFNEANPNFSELEEKDTKDRWRDFVIKTIDKDSNTHVANIVAKEAFVNELGKNGWAVTLDSELENSYGTVIELAEKVLSGSDWTVDVESFSPIEAIEEPLFEATLDSSLTAKKQKDESDVNIAANAFVYFFYDDVEWNETNSKWVLKDKTEYQILYFGKKITDDLVDDNLLVVDDNFDFNCKIKSENIADNLALNLSNYRGQRIQNKARTEYEPVLNRYVEIYQNGGQECYSYTETEYHISPIVQNYLTNSSNFTSDTGWYVISDGGTKPQPELYPNVPPYEDSKNTLLLKGGIKYYNNGPVHAGLNVFPNEKYIVYYECAEANPSITFALKKRADVTGDTNYGNFSTQESKGNGWYQELTVNTYSNKEPLVLTIQSAADCHLYSIELFKKVENNGVIIFPGDAPAGTIEEVRYYYTVDDNKEVTYISGENYSPKVESGYKAVRSFETRESNYFNNIQSLAELFEVWVGFKVAHKKNGKIWLDDNNLPLKQVCFYQYSPTGKDNYAGFKYGINLKDIKRTVDSNAIASKIIVKPNNQEYATDGMCTIARAPSNPSGETEILNFDYYVSQKMIEPTQVINDLYGTSNLHLRLIPRLKKLNDEINDSATKVNAYGNVISELKSQLDLFSAESLSYENEIAELTQFRNGLNSEDEKYTQYQQEITRLTNLKNAADAKIGVINTTNINDEKGLAYYKAQKAAEEEIIEIKSVEKEALKKEFYNKYSRFIQEGTWTDESYVDDELYYLDAKKISNVSAYPQVSYTINVLSVEDVDGYEAYRFNVGDRTYIEDVEFFGYSLKNIGDNLGNVSTPYRMPVIVTERSQNFDDPSKTTITIKNYKNQFEELFQKITATTQNLQYQMGEYARAANVVTPTGEIKVSTLEQSFQNNSMVLSGSDNQSVIWDTGTGIEVIDNRISDNRVRVVGGGVFITTDGGVTWSNAISGNGINTRYLVAGQIDASKINLVNGNVPYFRWDKDGISAFRVDDTNGTETYDLSKYVRFNQYGLYAVGNGGVKGNPEFDENELKNKKFDKALEYIESKSNFSLTWKGLVINATGNDNSTWQTVKLDATEGLRLINSGYTFTEPVLNDLPDAFKRYGVGDGTLYVEDDDIPILAIGQFPNIGNEPVYGLRMRNKDGYVTLSTDNRGELWVQDKIFVGQWNNLYGSSLSTKSSVGLNAINLKKNDLTGDSANEAAIALYTLVKGVENVDPDSNEDFSPYSVRIWAGNTDATANGPVLESAPFVVLNNGALIAKNAFVDGEITAKSGKISGLLTIGENDNHGISGAEGSEYIIWGGRNDDGYQFAVDNSGKLFSKNAEIEGKIVAKSGSIEELLIPDGTQEDNAGISSNGDVVLWVGKESGEGKGRNSSKFYVTNGGAIHASQIFLTDSIMIGEGITNNGKTYYKAGVNQGGNYAFWAGANSEDYSSAVFSVNLNGDVTATSLNIGNGKLTAADAVLSGTLKVGEEDSHIVIDGNDGSISTANFNTAQGWKIEKNGDAYFSNINARGEIVSAVFSYNSVNSMGGDLFLAPTYYDYNNTVNVIDSLEGPQIFTIEVDEITFDREIWSSDIITDLSDIENLAAWKEKTNYKSVKFNCLIDGVDHNNYSGRLFRVVQNGKNYFYIFYNSSSKIATGLTISNFSVSLTSGCGINLTAGNALGPAVIITDISNGGEVITQLGRLSGVSDGYFGALEGYGLYGQNAYLTGKLYLPNAGITNDGNDGTSTRIWAGATPENKDKAPFRVTQDGSLYANKGTFTGIINAVDSTFSGWLKTAGVLIEEDDEISNTKTKAFYVAYEKNREQQGFPTPQDEILRIDKDGLSIWEGGLSVFSDYASGWRNGSLTENPHLLYGYNPAQTDKEVYPYIKAIDTENYHLYTSGTMVGRFAEDKTGSFVKINDGKISFINHTAANSNKKFSDLESEIFAKDEDWFIDNANGLTFGNNSNNFITLKTDNDENVTEIKGNLKVDDTISTTDVMSFVDNEDVIIQIKKYVGGNTFDRGIDFVI